MAKRGRRAKHYVTSNGETIIGLARRPSDGRWRFIGTDITFSEPDENLAIFRFRQWRRSQNLESFTFAEPVPLAHLDNSDWLVNRYPDALHLVIDQQGDITAETQVPTDVVWSTLRNFILSNPQLAAERLRIPEIGYLQDLPRPEASPPLSAIGEIYFQKAPITDHERRKSRLFWEEFVGFVGVKTVRELTAGKVADYQDQLAKAERSSTYVKHRVGKIKTILRFAQKRGIAPVEIDKALAHCRVLTVPRAEAADPHPIERKHFHALLDAADDKWKTILLCALNFCMYGKEVAELKRDEIQLGDRTLVANRAKTGVTRVAVLWERTVEAVSKLPVFESPYLVLNQAGAPFHADQIRRGFDRLRDRAGVSYDVKFADIRDGAYTAAVQGQEVEFEKARVLAGHKAGMSDHYVKRNPSMVSAACTAIERVYFE